MNDAAPRRDARGRKVRDLLRMALVARMFYIGGHSKTEIADELHLTRFQVARLLDRARLEGIVRIEVGIPGNVDIGLAAELRDHFGLQHAVVIDADEADWYALLRQLSGATMRLLSEIVTKRDVLGLASARALLGLPVFDDWPVSCPIVQLNGAISRPDEADIIHAVQTLARSGGGQPFSYYAPLIAASRQARDTYLAQPDVARGFAMMSRITVAALGVGSWAPTSSTIYDQIDERDRQEASAAGVVAEAAGVLLDRDCRPVNIGLSQRILAPSYEQLTRIPTVIGVLYKAERASAMQVVLRGRIVNSVVTHRSMAERLLSLLPTHGAAATRTAGQSAPRAAD